MLVGHCRGSCSEIVGPMKSLRSTISMSGVADSEVGTGEVETSIDKSFATSLFDQVNELHRALH